MNRIYIKVCLNICDHQFGKEGRLIGRAPQCLWIGGSQGGQVWTNFWPPERVQVNKEYVPPFQDLTWVPFQMIELMITNVCGIPLGPKVVPRSQGGHVWMDFGATQGLYTGSACLLVVVGRHKKDTNHFTISTILFPANITRPI